MGVKSVAPRDRSYCYLFACDLQENGDFVCLRLFHSFGPRMASGSYWALHKYLLK